jgi:hypothetical protein
MVIGIVEDGEARVYSSLAEAMDEWKKFPADLASDVIIFYDEDGTWLRPAESYLPVTWYRWRRKLASVVLERAGKTDDYQDPLPFLLHTQVTRLAPNKIIQSLDELKAKYPWNPD